MKKQVLFIALFLLHVAFIHTQSTPISTQKRVQSAVIASAVGDALGRVTEFIPTTDAIFAKYPHGINSFDDFMRSDWGNLPARFQANYYEAPYTDDTAMTLIVMEELVKTTKNNYSLEKTMGNIAQEFVATSHDKLGWAANFRAPGISTKKAVKVLEQKINNNETGTKNWWAIGDVTSGGCGSVMHAYPFGIIFAHDLEKAAHWSAQHSLITHGHPWATASCAAMAVGMAQALNPENSPEKITSSMIEYARRYDNNTALKIEDAVALAHKARKKLSKFTSINQALADTEFRAFHNDVFMQYQGWRADDAIAATAYVFTLFPDDIKSALYTGVHTPGDSDSIACMAGALVGARDTRMPPFFKQVENYFTLCSIAKKISPST